MTTIPFWHSMEGELGKEVILWPNVLTPKTRITKLYRPIRQLRTEFKRGDCRISYRQRAAILQVYEVGTATMMASKAINRYMTCLKRRGFSSMSRSLCDGFRLLLRQQNRPLTLPAVHSSTPVLYYNKDAFKKAGLDRNSRRKPGRIWRTMPRN